MVMSIHHPRYLALREHLKALRLGAGMTQIDIANKLGLDQSYISKIERGERYVDILFYVDWCIASQVKPEKAVKLLQKMESGVKGRSPFVAR
jgi:transcriptional regulator with XRE-family HTH domain